MGRPKTFDDDEVLRSAAAAFIAGGYEGTSVDDLVRALNVHRGSLYKAFGSKRGLFLAVLGHYVRFDLVTAIQSAVDENITADGLDALTIGSDLDLLLIAAIERGHHDAEVASLVRQGIGTLERVAVSDRQLSESAGPANGSSPDQAIRLLGARLYRRLLAQVDIPDPARLTTKGI